MNTNIEPLFNDEFIGEPPTKRLLAYIQSKREEGSAVAGIYCGYAPLELLHAMDIIPALLCAFSNNPIKAAEDVLPANLCPLIKSSYGFIITDTCPFYALSEAVIAETTCDGKKKMFELIADRKPLHVMDLPQVPDHSEARRKWTAMIRHLQGFLEETFGKKTDDAGIEKALRDANRKGELMRMIFNYAAMTPSVISWKEMYDITFLAGAAKADDIIPKLQEIILKLKERVNAGYAYGREGAPRVLVTGCPVGGDAGKVFRVIEEAGGVVVALDSCTGMKGYMQSSVEGTPDPVASIAEKYLALPCSCMTPNTNRIAELDRLIGKFKPHAVIDVILHACHTYNVESYKIGEHVKNRHGLPFLKIETDYSTSDVEQIRTRVEAVFEQLR